MPASGTGIGFRDVLWIQSFVLSGCWYGISNWDYCWYNNFDMRELGDRMKTKIVRKSETDLKKGVSIEEDKYGMTLLTTRNGYHWTGMGVDQEMLEMIHDMIRDNYL